MDRNFLQRIISHPVAKYSFWSFLLLSIWSLQSLQSVNAYICPEICVHGRGWPTAVEMSTTFPAGAWTEWKLKSMGLKGNGAITCLHNCTFEMVMLLREIGSFQSKWLLLSYCTDTRLCHFENFLYLSTYCIKLLLPREWRTILSLISLAARQEMTEKCPLGWGEASFSHFWENMPGS